MQKVLQVLLSRWALSLCGVVILSLMVWFLGDLITLLEGWIARLAVILALLVIWAAANLGIDLIRRRRDRNLASGVSGAVRDDGAAQEEADALGERMSEALALLKKARGTRGYLYEQPWYVIIGPPSAGKTTALLNSGLNFPLAAEMGQRPIAGVGGTRLCDWWFTDNAVLIDTAGRYTTQDSNAEVDRAGWEAFLKLLKRTRPSQPLNGVIVAISVTEIASASAATRTAHAQAIRLRIKELKEKLGIELPVYALFTKADLVSGFTEFFDDLNSEKRDQVWGVTFPLPKGNEGVAKLFSQELDILVDRLNQRLYDRLQSEMSPERRTRIAGFPTQMASLSKPLQAFLDEAFGGSRLDPAPLLRGVYFTSGTQEGTPIDRLTGAMMGAFGLDQRNLEALRPQKGRSYFLGRLVSETIFGEAMLVSEPPSVRLRRFALRAASFAAIGLATLGIGGWLAVNQATGSAEVVRMNQAFESYMERYRELAAKTSFDPVNDADLANLLPLLNAARDLSSASAAPGLWGGLDLSQTEKLRAGASNVYEHVLANAFLPRLVWRLEGQMRGFLTQPTILYEATRVYLMLQGQGPLAPGLVREWMMVDWKAQYPGAAGIEVVNGLEAHLNALLALKPFPAVPANEKDDLLAAARIVISNVSLAERAYSRIRSSPAAHSIPEWRPSDALGPAGVRVFVRASGRSLNEGIPGFFTAAGFHKILLPALTSAAQGVASESWVLGRKAAALDQAERDKLANDIVKLYVADYAKAWDAMLQDLEIVPLRSVGQAAQDLYILGSTNSPMRALLQSIAQQLTLTEAPKLTKEEATAAAARELEKAAKDKVSGTTSALPSAVLEHLRGGTAGNVPILPPGHEIDERYKELRGLTSATGGAPIDQVLKVLVDVTQQLAKLNAASSVPAAGGIDASPALRAEADRQPQPLKRWLQTIAASSIALRSGDVRQQISAAYNGAGGPASLCAPAVNGRFPFVANAREETPLDDFAKLFAPGGLLDGFFNTRLRPFVDTTGKVWQPMSADGIPAPVSAADVAQFQRASVIRDLFFAPNSTAISVRFDILPLHLDSGASQVSLDFEGTQIVNSHGPSRSTQVIWPGPNRMQNVRLVFEPPPRNGTGVISESGPWAMFRLFSRGVLSPTGSPDRYTLTFTLGERSASFELRAGSVMNPFAPGVLREFRCPSVRG